MARSNWWTPKETPSILPASRSLRSAAAATAPTNPSAMARTRTARRRPLPPRNRSSEIVMKSALAVLAALLACSAALAQPADRLATIGAELKQLQAEAPKHEETRGASEGLT